MGSRSISIKNLNKIWDMRFYNHVLAKRGRRALTPAKIGECMGVQANFGNAEILKAPIAPTTPP